MERPTIFLPALFTYNIIVTTKYYCGTLRYFDELPLRDYEQTLLFAWFFSFQPQQTDTSSIIHFEKEVDDDDTDDDDGDDELWHSETYEFESDGENPSDPDNYSWCLMNLGIVKFVQRVLRSTISLTGMEVLGNVHEQFPCIYIRMYIHACMHAYIHTYIHTYI